MTEEERMREVERISRRTRESIKIPARSEEHRVGKESRSRWSPYH